MKINVKNIKKSGFTIVELLVYLAGLLALGTVMVLIIVQFYGMYKEIIMVPRSDRVALSLVDRITKEIRSADSIDTLQSQFGTTSGVFDFDSVSSGVTTEKRFYVENGIVKYSENLGTFGSKVQNITPKDLFVSNFNFTLVSTPVSEAVRFNLELEFETRNSIETKSYTGFAILRESYE